MHNRKKMFIALAGATVASVASGVLFEDVALANDDVDSSQNTPVPEPTLIISEILPNAFNDGTNYDAFEFIEIYNNSSETINFKDYTLNYLNLTNPKNVKTTNWSIQEEKLVKPGEALVIWVKNSGDNDRTVSDFITYYNETFSTSLIENQVTTIQTDGMHNNNPRQLEVLDAQGNKVSTAQYPVSQGENVSTHFTTTSMDSAALNILKNGKPSPGIIEVGQVNGVSPGTEEPPVSTPDATIVHTAQESIHKDENLKVTASIKGSSNITEFKLRYRTTENGSWLEKDMEPSMTTADFAAIIPSTELTTSALYYYFSAVVDGVTITSKEFSVEVQGNEVEVDYQKLPELLVTELVPDSTNVGGSDGYEFIEVYNNADQTINMKDYTIVYRYPDSGPEADVVWTPEERDINLAPGESIVYWIINANNTEKTVEDFKAFYKTSNDYKVVKIYSGGMANSSARGVLVTTNTGYEISSAYYMDQKDVDDTIANKGIQYLYPQDGGTTMSKISYDQDATPGFIDAVQKPAQSLKLKVDGEKPIFDDITDVQSVGKLEDLSLSFNISDETQVKTVQLLYKTEKQSEYTSVFLKNNKGETQFNYTIDKMELLGQGSVTYKVIYSDGTTELTSEPKTIAIESSNIKEAGLNIENGSVVSGKVLVKSFNNNDAIQVNEADVTSSAYAALPTNAYFVFDANKVNMYFQNGVTMGDEILSIFDDTINEFTAITTEIDATRFATSNEITVTIRTGNKLSPFDQSSEENRDDFTIKNIRLVLEDGTVLYDPNYTDKKKEIAVNDVNNVFDFTFTVPAEKFSALEYAWDTTQLKDGKYTLTAGSESVEVFVDNTSPIIESSIEQYKEYKGNIVIHPKVKDASPIKDVKVTLDGREITVPYETSSAALTPGAHTLVITAVDIAGNESVETIEFSTVNEHPNSPEIISPADGSNVKGRSANLQVKVSDATGDDLTVQFYEGYKYNPIDEAVTVYANAADTEPPAIIAANDDEIVSNEWAISEVDGVYVEESSIEQFPYHRFEVKVDEAVDADDEIVINWNGKSLEGRKVSLYVWNYNHNNWEMFDSTVAVDENNFELKGSVLGSATYVKDHKVQVIVQDEIAATSTNDSAVITSSDTAEFEYDYSFVWMSDTQYYSESYPHIFEKMTQWVADNKEALNIQYVFHTGDLVDEADKLYQWENANQFMQTLESAGIPYGVLAGNHDVDQKSNDYTEYSKWFGEERFENQVYYGESYKDNRGHYDLISANGNDYIMVYMGWGVSEEDMQWMNKVLAEHPERIAILNFHEYLLVSGNRSPIGNEIYEKVVKPNKNVVAVLSGHYHDAETFIDTIDDNGDGIADRTVYQMLADYQGGPEGGQGYLRILKVNQATDTIKVETYSPYLDDYNYYNIDEFPNKDEFTMDVALAPQEKLVATDAFKVEVRTNKEIGKAANIASGATAQAVWSGLQKNQQYGWYVTVSDEFGGQTVSDVQTFTTSRSGGSGNGGSNDGSDSGSNNGSNNNSGGNNNSNGNNSSDGGQPPASGNAVTVDESFISEGSTVVVKANNAVEGEQSTFTLTSGFIDLAIEKEKTVELNLQDGTQAILDQTVLAELKQDDSEDIKISISYGEKTTKEFDGKLFSDTLEVRLTAADTKISVANKVEVRVPMDQNIDSSKTASFKYNEMTAQWEYAGGYEEDGYWITLAQPNTIIAVGSKTVELNDIKGHWANNHITSLASKGIINGTTKYTFEPSKQLTRKQFTALLVRALQIPVKEYEGLFPDVDENQGVDALQIEAAKRYGITTGKETGEFDPNTPITRQQMTAMLIRALKVTNPSLLKQASSNKEFLDEKQISNYAKEFVQQAASLGLIQGKETGKFEPKENASRAHAAAVIDRFLTLLQK